MQLLVFMDFGDNELFPLMLEETMHQSFLLPPFQVPRGEKRRGQSRGAPLLRKSMPDTVCEQEDSWWRRQGAGKGWKGTQLFGMN